MRIGAIVRSYYLTDYLPYVLKQFDYCEKIIVPNYRYNDEEKDDNTYEIVSDFKNAVVTVDLNGKSTQAKAFNDALILLQDMDYVWICDADELIKPEDQEFILSNMGKYKSCLMRVIDYVDENHIYPVRDHKPIALVKPDVEFYTTRCCRGFKDPLYLDTIFIHHLGYTFSKEKMDWKTNNYWGNKKDLDHYSTKVKYNVPKFVKNVLQKT